jgi:hypothetical protein
MPTDSRRPTSGSDMSDSIMGRMDSIIYGRQSSRANRKMRLTRKVYGGAGCSINRAEKRR